MTYHRNFAELINNEFKQRITGEYADRISNNDSPESQFFASRLVPSEDTSFEFGKSSVNSFGFDFYASKNDLKNGSIVFYPQGEFYFRVEPTLEEQTQYMLRTYSERFKNDFKNISDIKDFIKKNNKEELNDINLVAVYQKIKWENEFVEVKLDGLNKFNNIFDLSDFSRKSIRKLEEKVVDNYKQYRNFKDTVTLNNISSQDNWKKLIARVSEEEQVLGWHVSFDIRIKEVSDNKVLISISFSNLAEVEKFKNRINRVKTIFNVGITLKVEKIKVLPTELKYFKDDFKYQKEIFAIGRNCSVSFDIKSNTFETTMMPEYKQDRLKTNDKISATFEELKKEPLKKLREINASMLYELENWKSEFDSKKSSLSKNAIKSYEGIIYEFNEEIRRFENGLNTIEKYPLVKKAFQLMNEAFYNSSKNRNISSWRLFQIVYIVSVIPDLSAREYTEIEYKEVVDLIYFPTGGGKTETYLGAVVFSMFFDRLRGKHDGVTAIIKFPLRLLSLQQLERALIITVQADLIRLKDSEIKDGSPFSVGYYVGDGNTPNNLKEIESINNDEKKDDKFKLIDICPYCYSNSIHIKTDIENIRIIHYCDNKNCTNPDNNNHIPLYITDTEVYRFLPTFIVSTLDKSAIVGIQRAFRNIIGSVSSKCSIHGFTINSDCPEKSVLDSMHLKCKGVVEKVKLYDASPSILIQDELHLVRESLGAYNSHYETFIRKLIEVINNGKRKIKIITSSATISEYKEHVYHLYHLPARRFPSESPFVDKNFYSFEEKNDVARIIVGLTPNGEQIIIALQYMIQHFREIVEYYHKNRDLLKSKEEFKGITDEIIDDLIKKYHVILDYNQKKSDGYQVINSLNDINSRLKRNGYSEINEDGCRTLTGDDTFIDVKKTLSDIDKPASGFPEVDLIAATNMISHGVDSSAFNLMLFYGIPKTTAEYIQAYSRVGRNHTGLVYVIFNMNKEKDKSYFHNFISFNKYKDILVESVPINRWADKALERTFSGLVSGYFLSIKDREVVDEKLYMYKGFKNYIQDNKERIKNELTDFLKSAYLKDEFGNNDPLGGYYDKRITELVDKLIEQLDIFDEDKYLTVAFDQIGFHVMNSFRDIEEAIKIKADTQSSMLINKM